MAKFDPTEMTAAQLRAARGLVGWTADELARKSGVSVVTVRRAETVNGFVDKMLPQTKGKIVRAFLSADLMFIGGDEIGGVGVRLLA